MWTIEYDNEVGPNDDRFREWCIVTDGTRQYRCDTESDARWLCELLNRYAG